MREWRDTFRAAEPDPARHTHQIADHGDTRGMRARALAVIERIRAEFAAKPPNALNPELFVA